MEEIHLTIAGSKLPAFVTKAQKDILVHGEGELRLTITVFPAGFKVTPSSSDAPPEIVYKVKTIIIESIE